MNGRELSATLTYLTFSTSLIKLLLSYNSEIYGRKEEANKGYLEVIERAKELENDKNGRLNLELCHKIKLSPQYIQDMAGVVYTGLISAEQARREVFAYLDTFPIPRSKIPRISRGV